MRRRVTVWLASGALLAALAGVCSSAPECKTGSVKAEGGKLYYCQDDGNGPRWVKQ